MGACCSGKAQQKFDPALVQWKQVKTELDSARIFARELQTFHDALIYACARVVHLRNTIGLDAASHPSWYSGQGERVFEEMGQILLRLHERLQSQCPQPSRFVFDADSSLAVLWRENSCGDTVWRFTMDLSIWVGSWHQQRHWLTVNGVLQKLRRSANALGEFIRHDVPRQTRSIQGQAKALRVSVWNGVLCSLFLTRVLPGRLPLPLRRCIVSCLAPRSS